MMKQTSPNFAYTTPFASKVEKITCKTLDLSMVLDRDIFLNLSSGSPWERKKTQTETLQYNIKHTSKEFIFYNNNKNSSLTGSNFIF